MARMRGGKISQLILDPNYCYVGLTPHGDPDPKDHRFLLARAHPNYNAIYSMLLVWAEKDKNIILRLEKDIVSGENAPISSVEVNY